MAESNPLSATNSDLDPKKIGRWREGVSPLGISHLGVSPTVSLFFPERGSLSTLRERVSPARKNAVSVGINVEGGSLQPLGARYQSVLTARAGLSRLSRATVYPLMLTREPGRTLLSEMATRRTTAGLSFWSGLRHCCVGNRRIILFSSPAVKERNAGQNHQHSEG
jgi:hypothetical protein